MNKKKTGLLCILLLLLCLGISSTALAAGENGWVKKGSNTYYYQNGVASTGWTKIEGKKYYFLKKTGQMVIGRYKIGKSMYYFDKTGAMVRKLSGAKWVVDENGRRFYNGNGKYSKKVWQTIQGKRYRFDKKGYVLTGWNKVGSAWYYFNAKGALVTKKWIKTDGALYYVGADGKRVSNTWVGKRYVGEDGKRIKGYVDETRNNPAKTGWVGYGRTWKYYVKGRMVTGWRTINGNRYFFQPTGFLKVGWYNDGRFYYFMNTNADHIGVMSTGWMKIDGNYYYFFTKKTQVGGTLYPKGGMARGIGLRSAGGGKTYYFDSKGVCTNFND